MNKTAVLALGGNAIIKAGEKGTITQQFANTRESLSGIVELIKRGYHLSITHGNLTPGRKFITPTGSR